MLRVAVRNGRSSRMLETRPPLTFQTSVDVGSFTRAGVRLGLSQPAISQHIRALEREVGAPLLVRLGKSAKPTPQGEMLLHYARHVLGKIEEVERLLAEAADGRTGVLRIGAGGAACQHLLPGVLREFRSRFPKVDLHVRSGYTQLTLGRVLDGDLDVGLVTLPLRAPQVRVTEVGRDELVVIVPPQQPWAARRRVPAGEVAGKPLVLYERQSQATHRHMRVLLQQGDSPRDAAIGSPVVSGRKGGLARARMTVLVLFWLNVLLLSFFASLTLQPRLLGFAKGGKWYLTWFAVGLITLMDELTSVFYAPAEAHRFIGTQAIFFIAATSLLMRVLSTRMVEIAQILELHDIRGGGVYSFSYFVLGPVASFVAVASIMVSYILTACISP